VNQPPHQQYADLRAYRQNIFLAISKRRDAAFNLIDALLERPTPRNIAELSLSPHCPRQWSSLYDAVEEAVISTASLEATYRHYALKDWHEHGQHAAQKRGLPCMVLAGDASVWRRSSCRVVDGLRYCQTQTHEVNGRGIVIGHQYQLLRYISDAHTSWVMPLANDRLGKDDTQASLGAAQLKRLSASLPHGMPCIAVYDGAFGCAAFLEETMKQRCAVIARTRKDGVLFHPPAHTPDKRRGAPKVYGDRFKCSDAATWSGVHHQHHFNDQRYGAVMLQRWHDLLMHPTANQGSDIHARQTPLRVDLMRCVTHYNTPRQHEVWLVLQRNELPLAMWSDAPALWRSFDARASIEQSIKASKQECSWTMPQTLTAKAADTWTHLSEIAFWHLFLVRKEAALTHFPWQKADAPTTPGRVRQSMAAILYEVDSPAELPRPRGNSPGWAKGRPRTDRKRIPVIYKTKKAAT
jgi:hypothetical protein